MKSHHLPNQPEYALSTTKVHTEKPRVLHICNWYPNVDAPGETPFIRRHISALDPHFDQQVWHIEVRSMKSDKWKLVTRSLLADRTYMLFVRTNRWLAIEWLTFMLLLWAWLTRDRSKRIDLVNIHIAYPLGLRTRFLLRLLKVPLVFTEQWSGYHYSFNSTSKGLDRIRRIFAHNVPLICVSHALLKDIEHFSGSKQQRTAVVDNVAETNFFHWKPDSMPQAGRFFAIAGWRFPKRPDVLIRMAGQLRDRGVDFQLRLAGDGKMMPDMKALIDELGLQDQVVLLGHLDPDSVAKEMRSAHALLHCSDYETYSAVCAESLCMGTPVIASNVGGIGEYMTADTGMLVEKNEESHWTAAVLEAWDNTLRSNRQLIADHMYERASTKNVGARYSAFLYEVLRDAPQRKKTSPAF